MFGNCLYNLRSSVFIRVLFGLAWLLGAGMMGCERGRGISAEQQALIDRYARQGLESIGQGQYEKAIDEFQKALALSTGGDSRRDNPRQGQIRKDLAFARMRNGDLAGAEEEYKKVLRGDPKDAEACNDLACTYAYARKDADAIRTFQEAIRLGPDRALFYCNLALLYDYIGQYESAIPLYRKTLALEPNRNLASLSHHRLAGLYLKGGKYDEAAAEAQRAVVLNPDYADTRARLGLAYFKQGRYDLAAAEYKAGLAIDPNCIECRYGLGNAYIRQGRVEEGRREMALFQKLEAQGLYEDVLRLFFTTGEKVREGQEDREGPHYRLGRAYAGVGQYDAAIAEYRKVLEGNPTAVAAYGGMGDVYQQGGKLDSAAVAYERVIALSVDREVIARTYGALGKVYQRKGLMTKAVAAYRKAAEMAPRSAAIAARAYGALGVLYLEAKDFDQAASAFIVLIGIAPDDAQARYALGLAYIGQGRRDRAAVEFQTALRLDRRSPVAGDEVAKTYLETDVSRGPLTEGFLAWAYYRAGMYNQAEAAARRDNDGNALLLDRIAAARGKAR